MGTTNKQFLADIQTVLADKEMCAKEIYQAVFELKCSRGRRRKVLPTYQQVVSLLLNKTNFILVDTILLTRGRKTRIYRNIIQEEE